MIEIVKTGLETTIQELPGRIGFWESGIPPSGPADAWSFRLANLLVGNHRDTAALEWQFIGPTLRFETEGAIALTGAESPAQLDGKPVLPWTAVPVRPGQLLSCGAARVGARGYVAVAGGLQAPLTLGSRATFSMAGIGGMSQGAVSLGERIPVGAPRPFQALQVAPPARPPMTVLLRLAAGQGRIAAVFGPNDGWLDGPAIEAFFEAEWTLLAQSSRTGLRLSGPAIEFAERAHHKRPEHGSHPSNILDHGYPIGGISIGGQTPIVFINDSPSAGGFIVPFTVPGADLWRLGQARPGEKLRFRIVNLEEANAMRRRIDALCRVESLIAAVSA